MTMWGQFKQLGTMVEKMNEFYESRTVYPEKSRVFRVFRETPYDELKVVMLFQDPYHDGSATGIAVANEPLTKSDPLSPTLRILMEEWMEDEATKGQFDTSLLPWAKQGVLLLNCALTVEATKPESHLHFWKPWTEHFLVSLSMRQKDLVYVLLGRKAQAWEKHIINGKIIKAPHPAAETYAGGGAGFYGSRIFTKTNELLKAINKQQIIW